MEVTQIMDLEPNSDWAPERDKKALAFLRDVYTYSLLIETERKPLIPQMNVAQRDDLVAFGESLIQSTNTIKNALGIMEIDGQINCVKIMLENYADGLIITGELFKDAYPNSPRTLPNAIESSNIGALKLIKVGYELDKYTDREFISALRNKYHS
jgi:hypothetical protein